MPRSNRRVHRTSTKTTKAKEAPPPPAAPLPPTTQTSPLPTSLGSTFANGLANGVGWGVGTSAVKAALGMGGDSGGSPCTTSDTTATTRDTFPHDACGTLWVAYQRCLYESGGGHACDPVKQGFDAVCPGFQAPLEGVVREATTPAFPLSLPPL